MRERPEHADRPDDPDRRHDHHADAHRDHADDADQHDDHADDADQHDHHPCNYAHDPGYYFHGDGRRRRR
jgi:zinc transport system substrate-binding protein